MPYSFVILKYKFKLTVESYNGKSFKINELEPTTKYITDEQSNFYSIDNIIKL